ncbi:MAG: tRNA isopentenyl-2-thiomethyl-A-37 hydroxylase MiaE, partial [Pseudomonadota bacterium]
MHDFHDFLLCPTPTTWLEDAVADIPTVLVDHANCEKKAAATAVGLLFRYAAYDDLTFRMSRLAREELRHFEQVQRLMAERDIEYVALTASRYAAGLMQHMNKEDPRRLIDTLIVGA